MKHTAPAVAAFAVVLHLAGCDTEPPSEHESVPTVAASVAAPIDPPADPAAISEIPRASMPARDGAVSDNPVATGSPEQMLQGWSEAMETRDFGRVYSYFDAASGAGGGSATETVKAWDKYRTIDVTVGEGRITAAGGSQAYVAPVTVTGETRDAKPVKLSGTITARPVRNGTGEPRWRIESTTLRP